MNPNIQSIIDDLYAESKHRDSNGCEFTEEDAENVITLVENIGMPYENALRHVLRGIEECLGW